MAIKVGVIGLGFMGSTHLDIYEKSPLAEVVALADVNQEKLDGDFSSICGNISGGDNSKKRNFSHLATYTSYKDLLANSEVEAVSICVPTFLHKEVVLEAIKAGKHILLEKPVARNLADAKELKNILEDYDKVFYVGLCIRYWPCYVHAYKAYKNGEIGKLKSASFKRISPNISGDAWQNWFMTGSNSGGALLDLHIHDVDFIAHTFGKSQKVRAFGLKGFRTDDAVDYVVSHFDYGDGCLVVAEGGWHPAKGVDFEMSFLIVGDKKTLILDKAGSYKVIDENGKEQEPKLASTNGWEEEIQAFLTSIESGQVNNDFSWVESMELVTAIEKSVANNQTEGVQ